MPKFPVYKQSDAKDCGPTCIKIVAKHYGKTFNIQKLRDLSETTREGSALSNVSEGAEKLGFRTLGVKLSLEKLVEAPLPCILHLNKEHYVVLYKVQQKSLKVEKLFVSDPGFGLLEYNQEEFIKFWIGNNASETAEEGIVPLLEPTLKFYNDEFEAEGKKGLGFSLLFQYILPYKSFLVQLIIGLFAGSLLQVVFPFLTQSIVDVGIQNQNMNFIYLILFAQIFLFFGKTALEFIRSWILLHLSSKINISLISDFFIKLMSLPISFFDTRMTGDIIQRINDHHRIERILLT